MRGTVVCAWAEGKRKDESELILAFEMKLGSDVSSQIVEEAIAALPRRSESNRPVQPIVIWLSGHAHTNDKLAMKEIGRQLVLQTGSKDLSLPDDETETDADEENERAPSGADEDVGISNLASLLVSHCIHLLPNLYTYWDTFPAPTFSPPIAHHNAFLPSPPHNRDPRCIRPLHEPCTSSSPLLSP